MQSYIIHMSKSTARRPNAERLLRDLPGAELVEAVDGRDPGQIADLVTHPGDLFRPRYPFDLRAPEVGVFASHRACWQRIVDSGDDCGLVVEDDLAVDPDRLARALDMIAAQAARSMYVRLPVKQRERPARMLAEAGDLRLILPRVIGLQCIAQVVGRDAAQRLLHLTARIDRPVDTLLQMHWITGQPVHAVLGTGNREVAPEIGGSTIQTKTPPGGKLRRELARAWYRAQMHLRPQR
ncbi:glycosyltransferase family 25 protein [Arenibacterium halophilum]|uniref:Glycosyltransferase family 25 protein n=2 Tax=Arenibacterium halophilum TaxID=2583821 RepID=A0ABY2X619_9RHOB|nr:glycosyltransferase family 25 protein [Arenibacterium halophilum]TMV10896.1 glycosyltransferase family 25 protein [Arenibacterium halophilum]